VFFNHGSHSLPTVAASQSERCWPAPQRQGRNGIQRHGKALGPMHQGAVCRTAQSRAKNTIPPPRMDAPVGLVVVWGNCDET